MSGVLGPRGQAVMALALALSAHAPRAFAEELDVEGEITSVLLRDQDGDGLKEIWVSYHAGGQRFIGIFRGAPSYARAPEAVVPVDPQAIFFAVGDYDPAPGLELALISRTSGVLFPLGPAKEAGAVRKLFDADLFFSLPSRSATPAWLSAARLDIDSDGIEDFALPERRRLVLFLGGGGAPARADGGAAPWRRPVPLPVGYYLLGDTREEKVSRVIEDFAEEDKTPAPLLEAAAAFPFPAFMDFDGDARLDVIVKQPGQRLEVFLQTAPGQFSGAASRKLHVPWARDASSLQLIDVNGDRKLDAVAAQLLLKELATEVKVFLQDPERPEAGFAEPRQVLRVQGFFRTPVLADADLDGRIDLIVSTYRVDLLEQLKKSVADEMELTHEIFTGAVETPFERRPSFQERFLLRTKDLEGTNARPTLYAGHDLTGDGRPDILFIDGGSRLRLRRGLPGKPIRYEESLSFAERVEDAVSVDIADLDGRGGDEAILRFESRLEVHRAR